MARVESGPSSVAAMVPVVPSPLPSAYMGSHEISGTAKRSSPESGCRRLMPETWRVTVRLGPLPKTWMPRRSAAVETSSREGHWLPSAAVVGIAVKTGEEKDKIGEMGSCHLICAVRVALVRGIWPVIG